MLTRHQHPPSHPGAIDDADQPIDQAWADLFDLNDEPLFGTGIKDFRELGNTPAGNPIPPT
jgi:hypothetical protein